MDVSMARDRTNGLTSTKQSSTTARMKVAKSKADNAHYQDSVSYQNIPSRKRFSCVAIDMSARQKTSQSELNHDED